MKIKRLVSLLLAAVMVFALLPVPALAEGGEPQADPTPAVTEPAGEPAQEPAGEPTPEPAEEPIPAPEEEPTPTPEEEPAPTPEEELPAIEPEPAEEPVEEYPEVTDVTGMKLVEPEGYEEYNGGLREDLSVPMERVAQRWATFGLERALITPSAYDLREYGRVTSVKNQSPYGSCWAHAAMAAAESNLITNGSGSYDLSELQLTYFSTHRVPYTAAGDTTGDETVIVRPVMSGGNDINNHLDWGGNIYVATTTLANWAGYAQDSGALSYSKAASTLNTKIPDEYCYDHNAAYLRNAYWVDPADSTQYAFLRYAAL